MSKWIECDVDASTGKPYLWKCDECGEEVTTRWNYCPECGDPKTSKGKNIETLIKAMEDEHRKLREMQTAQPHTYRGVTLNDVMMYFDSLEGNEDAWTEFCSCLECRGWGLYHIRSATDKNVGTTDTISRKAAVDIAKDLIITINGYEQHNQAVNNYSAEIMQLPPAQPEQNLDEWCTDCKEYDKEKHCCPRWNRVIKNTVDELKSAQPEPCEDAVSREEVLNCLEWQYPDKLPRTKIMELPPVTPKQRTGHWIPVGIAEAVGGESAQWGSAIAYHKCSECDGQALGDDFEQEVLSKWCPHCGAKMEVTGK